MWITASVTFDSDEQAREAERLVREKKLAGISADLGNVTSRLEVFEVDDVGLPVDWLETVEKGEVVGGTLVPMPALGDARIVSNPDGTLTAWLVAEGTQTSDRRIINLGALEWRDPAPLMFTDTTSTGHDGAVFVGNLTNFARVDVAMVATFQVVADYFADPQLPAVTKPHVQDGRYQGHGAQWGVCHLAFPGCVTPPETATGYDVARWKEVDGQKGVPIYRHPKGDIHAPLHLTLEEARDWYDEHCTLEGLTEVGDDLQGIWVSGSASAEIDGMFLSGDWRLLSALQAAGENEDKYLTFGPQNLELIAFLACEKPAFPLALVASDVQTALVAAGVVVETVPPDPASEIIRRLAAEVVALRTEVEPLVWEREARMLLDGLAPWYSPGLAESL